MALSDPQLRRFIELRKHPRLTPPAGALLSFAQLPPPSEPTEGSEGDGSILNLSRGGCKILTDIPVAVGKPYSLIIQVPSIASPIKIDSAIVRWAGGDMFGLRFDVISQDQLEQLREFLRRLDLEST